MATRTELGEYSDDEGNLYTVIRISRSTKHSSLAGRASTIIPGSVEYETSEGAPLEFEIEGDESLFRISETTTIIRRQKAPT